jgi:hypothetical protein
VAIFVIAFLYLRPAVGALSDAEYIAIAKATPQGQLYFKKYDAPCQVLRVFTVQVNCDYVPAGGTATEKFRVNIDPRTNAVIEVETDFTP